MVSQVSLSLVDDDASRAIWPFAFKLVYTLTLTKTQLKMDVAVTNNTEGKDLEFTMALHTYYRYNKKRNFHAVHNTSKEYALLLLCVYTVYRYDN